MKKQVTRLEGLLAQKVAERSRIVSLFRRGRLTDAELDAQTDEIGKEETALEAQAAELRGKLGHSGSIVATVRSAQTLLAELRKRLDEPISWELKRNLIEVLVGGIRVDTSYGDVRKQGTTTVTYRFGSPDGGMPLVLPQAYGESSTPGQPKSIGDHIRKRRLTLKLSSTGCSGDLGSHGVYSVQLGSEYGDTRFSAYAGDHSVPRVQPGTCAGIGGGTARWERVSHRLSQQAARRMGVDPGTLAKWERGHRILDPTVPTSPRRQLD